MKTDNRVSGLDALKCICAFLIVCIHIPFGSDTNGYFVALTRCAVPIFFMITGYFYRQTVEKKTVKKQMVKVAKLILISNALYLVVLLFQLVESGRLHKWLGYTFSFNGIAKILLLNDSPIQGHLWYLQALLYVLLIVAIFGSRSSTEQANGRKKFGGGYKKLYYLIPILLVVDVVFGKYSLVILKREIPFLIVRNWLFVGLPYFLLGDLINEWKEGRCSGTASNSLNKQILIALVLLFAITTCLERYYLLSIQADAERDHYISTTFLAVTLFLLFLELDGSKKIAKCFSGIGRKHSTFIYIMHPLMILAVASIVGGFELSGIAFEKIYLQIAPVVIFVITLTCSVFCKRLSKLGSIMLREAPDSDSLG